MTHYTSNRGSSNYSRSAHSTPRQKTHNIRVIAGLWASGFICYGAYFAYEFVSLISGAMDGVTAAALFLVSAGSLIALAVFIFKVAPGRGVRVVTYLCIGCVAVSTFLVPGFAGLMTLICIGVTIVGGISLFIYSAASRVISYKPIAVAIASLPIIGALFYVPATLTEAGLTVNFSQAAPASAPSAIAPQLMKTGEVVARSYDNSAVLSYAIRSNRLYADICKNGAVESVALDTKSIVRTPIPWLQWNLTKKLDQYLAPDQASSSQPATIFAPVARALDGFHSVMVADGALLNHSQRSVLPGKASFPFGLFGLWADRTEHPELGAVACACCRGRCGHKRNPREPRRFGTGGYYRRGVEPLERVA
jgi:hypothetical protein